MTRILNPIRNTESGIFYHQCPVNGKKITSEVCKPCRFLKEIKVKPTKNVIHCNFATLGPELTEFEPPKAHDEYKGWKGFDVINSPLHTWVEPKLDGARAIIHCTSEGVFITSRRRNKDGQYNQFQDNIPHIKNDKGLLALGELGETIFDGEIIMPGDGDSLGKTMGIVGSLPEHAIELQKSSGTWAVLNLFDISMVSGLSITNLTLIERRNYLERLFLDYLAQNSNITLVPYVLAFTPEEKQKIVLDNIKKGFEGAVIKNPNSSYFESRAWLKVKTKVTVDALVTGWEAGKIGGKWEKTIGALKVSVIDVATNQLREIAQVIPGEDSIREEMYLRLKDLSNEEIKAQKIIVEMEAQIWSIDYRLRHPRILRYRLDRSESNTVNFTTVQRV